MNVSDELSVVDQVAWSMAGQGLGDKRHDLSICELNLKGKHRKQERRSTYSD